MEIINRLRIAIEGLGTRDFYKYLIVGLGVVIILISFFIFRFYSRVDYLQRRIIEVNDVREEVVKNILKRMSTVEKQRKEVNDILAKEKDFKIRGYFKELLRAQNLLDNEIEENVTEVDLGNAYNEVSLSARFVNLTMQQLCLLLEAIEKKDRVYAKNLEIIRSTKTPKTIEANLTVATLQPKLKAGI